MAPLLLWVFKSESAREGEVRRKIAQTGNLCVCVCARLCVCVYVVFGGWTIDLIETMDELLWIWTSCFGYGDVFSE